jgi:EAL domain-containing protein (putative c-di-GMP-specific phosphodiesterase class I)
MTVPELLAGMIAELRPNGVSFALDGFGAGAFALRHFRELTFDLLKVDAQYSRGIHTHADNQVLMAAYLAIARQFDMLLVAQGVEQAAEADWLGQLGVDCLLEPALLMRRQRRNVDPAAICGRKNVAFVSPPV